jgi:hypothetical protein
LSGNYPVKNAKNSPNNIFNLIISQLILPEQTLLVDLRPAFEQPLDTVTPDIHPLG